MVFKVPHKMKENKKKKNNNNIHLQAEMQVIWWVL